MPSLVEICEGEVGLVGRQLEHRVSLTSAFVYGDEEELEDGKQQLLERKGTFVCGKH